METIKLNNGIIAINKMYVNETQARKAQSKIAFEFGVQTSIYHRGGRVFWLIPNK